MSIISIDLPWKENKSSRIALAVVREREVTLTRTDNNRELLDLIFYNAEQDTVILLDIPTRGCENLVYEHYRKVDKALSHQGIWTLPASKAGLRGKELEKELKAEANRHKVKVKVYEIYPYAVYKFLSFLKCRQKLTAFKQCFDSLLNGEFRKYKPKKYKRENNKSKRVKNMQYLYSLLNDSRFDLKFSVSPKPPQMDCTLRELDCLCDEYDACLGAIAGMYLVNRSKYACFVGDSKSGQILLLADEWLQEQFKKEINVQTITNRS